ncbi:larval cuticle protein A1A-like isoform X1 [Neodiprion virginianus]|uniref:larval cuticle protein A1A-like isoform X1 n=2 Tax=Neodiprion virginianus TaxID=2961670 RepID=UPI001EE72DEC|nr:larval cuticle protein A1A-like isoform X1 [Neodiprion virginianus]
MEQNCCDNSLAKEKEDVNSVLGERLSGARPRDEKLSGSFRRYKRLTTTQNCISNPQDITAAMAFKFITLFALVAAANAGVLAPAPLAYHAAPAYGYAAPAYGYAAPIAKAVVTKTVDADYDPNPQYSYSYDVQDSITGDNKQQHETRNGDVVQGGYSLIEADGTRRIVDYTADPVNGFNAVVRKEGAAVAVKAVAAPVVAKVAAPLAYAAPVAKYAAPLAYSAYAAPVAKYAAPLTYSTYGAPIAKYAAPLAYSAYAAPVAKYAAPLSYAAPAVAHAAPLSYTAYAAPTAHVNYAAPAYAYHH